MSNVIVTLGLRFTSCPEGVLYWSSFQTKEANANLFYSHFINMLFVPLCTNCICLSILLFNLDFHLVTPKSLNSYDAKSFNCFVFSQTSILAPK